MATLICFNNRKNYKNIQAVENVLQYILRIRPNEKRRQDLLTYGGKGIPLFLSPDDIINQFLYVQNLYLINSRKGIRIYHEVLSFTDSEYERLGYDINLIYQIAMRCSEEYFNRGHQVVFAIHYESEKHLHIHFAINSINYITGKKLHTNIQENRTRECLFQNIINSFIADRIISPFLFIENYVFGNYNAYEERTIL